MLKRKAKKQLSTTSDEKLMLFISIVSRGLSAPVLKIFQKCDVSGQFVLTGEGTARKEIRNILGSDIPLNNPDVSTWINDFLKENSDNILNKT